MKEQKRGSGRKTRPQGPRLRRGRRLHGCRICFLFFRVILSQWSGCKSSTRLWMWLWTHRLPLVSLPRLLIPGIRQLLLRLLRRAASPTNSPVFSPPPWVTVTASPLPSPSPHPPSQLSGGGSPGSSWQLERTFNNEKKHHCIYLVKALQWLFLYLGSEPKAPSWPSVPQAPQSLAS